MPLPAYHSLCLSSLTLFSIKFMSKICLKTTTARIKKKLIKTFSMTSLYNFTPGMRSVKGYIVFVFSMCVCACACVNFFLSHISQ